MADELRPACGSAPLAGAADHDQVVRALAERVKELTTLHGLALPGHSPDGLGLLLEEPRVLFAGDHLSPCEIPFVDDLDDYRATLRRLLALLPEVAEVVPGHGPRLSSAQAIEIARADLEYLEALAAPGEGGDGAAITLPRAADVPGMQEHHAENLVAARRR